MQNKNFNLPSTGFLRLPDVLKVFPVSKSKWWLGVKNGEFPKPVKLSERTTAWRVRDIEELINKVNQGGENDNRVY